MVSERGGRAPSADAERTNCIACGCPCRSKWKQARETGCGHSRHGAVQELPSVRVDEVGARLQCHRESRVALLCSVTEIERDGRLARPHSRKHRRFARYGLLDAVSSCEARSPQRASRSRSMVHLSKPEFVLAAAPRFT